ncbi:MAG: prolyl oligopeptidase family serine peptidase [Chitinivibrionales bacterium]|nr:prolyl oligopeptidase family serine peptidase [Chitinivibrionales bacterium]MBD3356868.1 prolyl oligopeptidase family serine peptidase [Chitinivibrionales bacterium]
MLRRNSSHRFEGCRTMLVEVLTFCRIAAPFDAYKYTFRQDGTRSFSSPLRKCSDFERMEGPNEDHWVYHAISAVCRTAAYLGSSRAVDADRIGIYGISGGGFITGIANSVTNLFADAASVYGAGDILGVIANPARISYPTFFAKRFSPGCRATRSSSLPAHRMRGHKALCR